MPENTTKTRRFSDALAISDGACNQQAVANSIANACAEVRAAGRGNDGMRDCPAVKLMVHQLAFLVGLPTGEAMADWDLWRDACRKAVAS